MPVRVADLPARPPSARSRSGLTWAADHGAKVANMSFAVAVVFDDHQRRPVLHEQGRRRHELRGQHGCCDTTPPTAHSCRFPRPTAPTRSRAGRATVRYVDVSAPGHGIWTTTMGGGYRHCLGHFVLEPAYRRGRGTNDVRKSELTPSRSVSLLESTAIDLGAPGYDHTTATVEVSAANAVAAAARGTVDRYASHRR